MGFYLMNKGPSLGVRTRPRSQPELRAQIDETTAAEERLVGHSANYVMRHTCLDSPGQIDQGPISRETQLKV